MSRKVIVIYEDNHGMIGLAETYEDAIKFLINCKWLTENFEIEEDGDIFTIKELLGNNWELTLLLFDINRFNEYFDGSFYLGKMDVYKAKE